ncbi:MAG: DNA mismatch repair protein MutS [Clostridiales bacterium]|nr:DNA mismatch repair protein MutS [Clostridiales bacterium]
MDMFSPMMQQYLEIKSNYADSILFFRLGDFYEMFFEDAKTVSAELGLTLTARDSGEEERAPMCGVPYHSADSYISKLVGLGHKVVICEQMENPSEAKGLVRREVVRIITPGTVTENTMLQDNKNNYLCSICLEEGEAALTFADVSTGDLYTTRVVGDQISEKIVNELSAYSPSEVILNIAKRSNHVLYDYFFSRPACMVNDEARDRFEISMADELIYKQFSKKPAELGLVSNALIAAVGAMLSYINETQRTQISYIKNLNVYADNEYLEIDINARRSLELTETMRNRELRGSLLWVLDKTNSAMGARVLRKWVEQPLMKIDEIDERLDAVEELYNNMILRSNIADTMRSVRDLERLMTKVVYGSAGGKDLRAIADTLSLLPGMKHLLNDVSSHNLCIAKEALGELGDVVTLINQAIVEDPPFSIRDGGFIRRGYHEEVDRLHDILENSKGYIESITAREREATGISKLKVGYNKVFGYFIEVTKSSVHLVPDTYIRKQTLANSERYITDELKNLEATILGAAEKVKNLEYELFCELLTQVKVNKERIQEAARGLALLDVYCALAETAFIGNYVRPEMNAGKAIEIEEGRHPVVEKLCADRYFVPNDTYLDTEKERLALITGPNMAGKSTYMRQTALLCIMAQIGSFVPAAKARLGLVDKVFTRVGASDDLASGQSTFMLEMNEVGYILKNATEHSLIIYDEIGRGTSTFDGMSIARAVAEYTCQKIKAKCLFATHYHELTDLAQEVPGIVNYHIAAKKKNDTVVFLRKIIKGAADDSYGIEVAKLAGLPDSVIRKAKEVLAGLETGETNVQTKSVNIQESVEQNVTFEDLAIQEVKDKLMQTSVETLTPIEAMNLLYQLKNMLA